MDFLNQLGKNQQELFKYMQESSRSVNPWLNDDQIAHQASNGEGALPPFSRELATYQQLMEQRKAAQKKRIEINELDYEAVKAYRNCTIHTDEQIKYYCRDDKQGLCPVCIL